MRHIGCKAVTYTKSVTRFGVLDVSATRQMHSIYPMQPGDVFATYVLDAEAGGHSPMRADAGEWHHLPDSVDLEGTYFPQRLTACIINKHKHSLIQTERHQKNRQQTNKPTDIQTHTL